MLRSIATTTRRSTRNCAAAFSLNAKKPDAYYREKIGTNTNATVSQFAVNIANGFLPRQVYKNLITVKI